MPQKKRQQSFDKMKALLFGLVVGLTVIAVSLTVIRKFENHHQAATPESRVSLGAVQYDFTGEKALKRSDKTITSLRAFLVETAKKDTSEDCPSYYSVVAMTSDETQALLQYGCYHASAPMFAIRDGNAWRTLSPTNHFDLFDIPECNYVDTNTIDKTIAPVCFNDINKANVYIAR